MASRALTLAGLQRELRAAQDVGEVRYAAELEAEIARLSAGSPANPARETAAARRPAAKRRG